jgi:hypothetical protein
MTFVVGTTVIRRLTPQFSGGALSYVQWHFIHDRPLQLLGRRHRYVVACSFSVIEPKTLWATCFRLYTTCAGALGFRRSSHCSCSKLIDPTAFF